ncbi:MAG: hypothetical protein GF403_07630 [Candidatus Coatesbacteria bacterium]|nr:hypothetical protein [Candidatus Coatesbacteria bacterium]
MELNDEIETLGRRRDQVRSELEVVSSELDELKATPLGRLCSARLVVAAEGVAEADDDSLEKADGLYAQLIADYPEEDFNEEAAGTHSLIREERCRRALASYEDYSDGLKEAKDNKLEQAESELSAIASNYSDTKSVREVEKLLKAIDREWDRRGRPVSASAFAADSEPYANQTIRVPGRLTYQAGDTIMMMGTAWRYGVYEFTFKGTNKYVSWEALDKSIFIGGRFCDDEVQRDRFYELAKQGTDGEIVLEMDSKGIAFRTIRIIIGNEVFEF